MARSCADSRPASEQGSRINYQQSMTKHRRSVTALSGNGHKDPCQSNAFDRLRSEFSRGDRSKSILDGKNSVRIVKIVRRSRSRSKKSVNLLHKQQTEPSPSYSPSKSLKVTTASAQPQPFDLRRVTVKGNKKAGLPPTTPIKPVS